MHWSEVLERYALDLNPDDRLQGEELWNAAASPSSYSSSDDGVKMGAASPVCLADRLVASMSQASDGQLLPSQRLFCSDS